MNILKTIVYKITVLQVSINTDKKVILDLRKLTPAELQKVYRTLMLAVKKLPSDCSLFVSKKQNF